MNNKLTIQVDWDTMDKIAICSMKSLLENLEIDLENRKSGLGIAIFDDNKKKDIAEIKKHINAFKTVIKYYGEGNEHS